MTVGKIIKKMKVCHSIYMTQWIKKQLGHYGKEAVVNYPFFILGSENIYLDDGVNIGAGSTIFTTRAKIRIGKNTFSGPNLTMISGDHPYVVGEYMLDISKEKLKQTQDITPYDKDINIGQDVWIGANVTIIKGVTVGRCAILAAGSVVVKDVPPYAIFAGTPARLIKFKWEADQILKHEQFLFSNQEERMTFDEIVSVLKNN